MRGETEKMAGSWIGSVGRAVTSELSMFLRHFVTRFPRSRTGDILRRTYWNRALGSRVVSYVGLGAEIGDCDLLSVGPGLILGDHGTLQVADSDPVFIGCNVAIAWGTYLRSANHETRDVTTLIREQGHTSKRIEYKGGTYSIILEDDVWVGANCVLLSGAFIGEGSIIAAGSVVSSAIPPFSIAVGNPARIVGNRKLIASVRQVEESTSK